MRPKPTCLRRLSLILYICFCLAPALLAAPARKGLLNLRQPDGTVVQAYLTGDENGHLVLTPDGCALMQDAEGWWCYARYDYYGHRLNTGEHAGDPDTPGEVIAASRNIPYQLIRQRRNARIRRAVPLRQKELARTRSGENGGVRHGLIILAQFQDLEFIHSRTDFENLINGTGPETALSYFKDQWKDSYTFRFDITEPVTLPHDHAYYGANNEDGEDEKAAQMIIDACAAVGPEIDFSAYDNDGDGEVDNVFVFYAGPNESEGAGDNYIWPHMWYAQSGAGLTYRRDGVLVDNYACTSELRLDSNRSTYTTLATIGTFCHEYTHTFGIPDLYDTDDEDSGGNAEAMWNCIDLMDAGNHNDEGKTPPNYSAVERWFFGMSEGKPLTEGTHTLRPVQENGDFYILETDHEDEIFLFECRQASGWDTYIGGSGLLIYHIDWSMRPAGESTSAGKVVKAWDRWDMNEGQRPARPPVHRPHRARPGSPAAIPGRRQEPELPGHLHPGLPCVLALRRRLRLYLRHQSGLHLLERRRFAPGPDGHPAEQRRKRHLHRLQCPGGQGPGREDRQAGRLPGRLHHPMEQPGPVLHREQRDPLRPGRRRPADRGRSPSL